MKNTAEFILAQFEKLGISLNPSCRLARQIDAYLDRKGVLPQILEPDHPQFPAAVEAHRDLSQVGFALKQLLVAIEANELKEKLNHLISDSLLPEQDSDQTRGRDTQCEVFVAALCARAGLSPIFDESPDIRCKISQQTIGVAVKRIKSPQEKFENRFEKRIREAADQIVKSELPGVIVTDISRSLNPANWRVPMSVSDPEIDAARSASNKHFRNRFESRLLEWTKGKHVRGIIVIDHIVRNAPSGRWHLELASLSISLCQHNQRRQREFHEFEKRFNQAILDPGEVPQP